MQLELNSQEKVASTNSTYSSVPLSFVRSQLPILWASLTFAVAIEVIGS
jgi:hypothetical protein